MKTLDESKHAYFVSGTASNPLWFLCCIQSTRSSETAEQMMLASNRQRSIIQTSIQAGMD